jgi:hypothetical protein
MKYTIDMPVGGMIHTGRFMMINSGTELLIVRPLPQE